jgi:hypothetical protein
MAENAATKQRGKPFPKGVSGNPSGKPRGCRHKATRVAQSLLVCEADALAGRRLKWRWEAIRRQCGYALNEYVLLSGREPFLPNLSCRAHS